MDIYRENKNRVNVISYQEEENGRLPAAFVLNIQRVASKRSIVLAVVATD